MVCRRKKTRCRHTVETAFINRHVQGTSSSLRQITLLKLKAFYISALERENEKSTKATITSDVSILT